MLEQDKHYQDQDQDESEELETDQYLVFRVQEQEYGLQALRIKEITQVLKLTVVPQAPSYVEGILNHRGDLISVISFRKKFGFATAKFDEDTRVVMVEKAGYNVGLLVDAVEEVIKITQPEVHHLPESLKALETYVTGVGMMGERLIMLLDPDQLFSKDEAAAMSKLMKEAGNTMQDTSGKALPVEAVPAGASAG